VIEKRPGNDPDFCVGPGLGSWNIKIFHFKPHLPPSSDGDEIQSEYFIRYENYREGIEILYNMKHEFVHLLQICELRFIQGDDIPMSPAKGGLTVGFHFTWDKKHDELLVILSKMEAALKHILLQPHFGKLFHMKQI